MVFELNTPRSIYRNNFEISSCFAEINKADEC